MIIVISQTVKSVRLPATFTAVLLAPLGEPLLPRGIETLVLKDSEPQIHQEPLCVPPAPSPAVRVLFSRKLLSAVSSQPGHGCSEQQARWEQEPGSEVKSVVPNSLRPHAIYSPWNSARILESVAFPFSRGSSKLRDRTQVSCIAGGFFTS